MAEIKKVQGEEEPLVKEQGRVSTETKERVKLLVVAVLSLIGYAVASYVVDVKVPILIEQKNEYVNVIKFIAVSIVSLSILVGSVSVVLVVFKSTFKYVWDSLVGNPLSSTKTEFSQSLHTVTRDIKTASEAMYSFAQRYENMSGDPEKIKSYYRALLVQGACGLHGSHCKEEKSLFNHLCELLVEPYANAPYHSQIDRNVVVHDLDDKHIKWDERDRYKIHHVEYQDGGKPKPYTLKYETSGCSPVMDVQTWANNFSLEILVGGKYLLTSTERPTVVEKKPDKEGFFCWAKGNEFWVIFIQKVVLINEWTEVRTHEVSINSNEDVVYNLTMYKPTYGLVFEFELPEHFEIVNAPRLEPAILYQAMEEASGVAISAERKPHIEPRASKNSVRVVCPEWILPGLALSISWRIVKP